MEESKEVWAVAQLRVEPRLTVASFQLFPLREQALQSLKALLPSGAGVTLDEKEGVLWYGIKRPEPLALVVRWEMSGDPKISTVRDRFGAQVFVRDTAYKLALEATHARCRELGIPNACLEMDF